MLALLVLTVPLEARCCPRDGSKILPGICPNEYRRLIQAFRQLAVTLGATLAFATAMRFYWLYERASLRSAAPYRAFSRPWNRFRPSDELFAMPGFRVRPPFREASQAASLMVFILVRHPYDVAESVRAGHPPERHVSEKVQPFLPFLRLHEAQLLTVQMRKRQCAPPSSRPWRASC
jgi:hypothetical protein